MTGLLVILTEAKDLYARARFVARRRGGRAAERFFASLGMTNDWLAATYAALLAPLPLVRRA